MSALYFGPEQRADRDAYVAGMRRAGHTLQEIGDVLGVSRERARQLAKRAGVEGLTTLAAPRIDPVAMLRFARSPECASFADCARRFEVDDHAVGRVFRSLGVDAALKRLYRWRRLSRLRALYAGQIRAFIATHGRPPMVREMNARGSKNGLPFASELQHAFGSLVAAWSALGIAPRPRGTLSHLRPRQPGTHCKRGHALTPDNLWSGLRSNGKRWRACKACHRASNRAWNARRKLKAGAA
jgi:hypothetical protein